MSRKIIQLLLFKEARLLYTPLKMNLIDKKKSNGLQI